MTVASNANKNTYDGNDSTTVFPITFPTDGIVDSEIKVYITNALGVSTEITTNFTVDLAALTVTYPNAGSPLATGDKIVILRELPYTQTTDLKNQGTLDAEALENTYDRLTYLCQQLREVLDRTPTGDVSVDVFDTDAIIAEATVQADAAAASATDSANSATDSANSATDSANSATDAANSASAAATSETNASSSASAAASSAAEGLYNNVVSKTFADSPIAPVLSEEGTLFRIDTSSGNVVVNLDSLSNYGEDMKFAFVKTTSDANTITINRGGTDTIEGGTSVTLSDQYEVNVLIGDSSSGTWLNSVQTAAISDGSVTLAKLADLANLKVIGRVAGSTGVPQAVDILDEDDMASDDDTALATQQSIKAYTDSSGLVLKDYVDGSTSESEYAAQRDARTGHSADTWDKAYEWEAMIRAGTISVYGTIAGSYCQARVYINGTYVTGKYYNWNNNVESSFTISGISVAKGDILSLYILWGAGGSPAYYTKNVGLKTNNPVTSDLESLFTQNGNNLAPQITMYP